MVITVALSTIEVVFPCQQTLIQHCQVGFIQAFFCLNSVYAFSLHTRNVSYSIAKKIETFKVQMQNSLARNRECINEGSKY